MAFAHATAGSQHAGEAALTAQHSEHVPVEAADRLTLVVKAVRTFIKDTGFFVFDGEPPKGTPAPRITVDGKPYFGKTFCVTGVSPTFGDHNRIGQEIDCVGQWTQDPRYGVQFKTLYINERLPASPEALENYLAAGRIKGIGPATAHAMIKRFGMECLHILEHEPERLLVLPNMTEKKVETAHQSFMAKKEVYGIVSYLGQYGIGENLATRVHEYFAAQHKSAIDEIQADPYTLIEVDGIGFKKADSVALALKIAADSPVRLRAALNHLLNERIQDKGDMAMPVDDWMTGSARDLGLSVDHIKPICQELVNEQKVYLRTLPVTRMVRQQRGREYVDVPQTQEMLCVSPIKTAGAEVYLARHVRRLIEHKPDIDPGSLHHIAAAVQDPRRKMDPSQVAGAWSVLTNPISVLTGGPGTGKTTTLKNIVGIAEELGWNVVLAAPTGRAAKRMEDAIGRESMTIHRRLGYKPGLGFTFNEQNPLVGDLFILDETSMVDTALGLAWLKAIPSGSRLLFVGDADQLPSVGPGDVMRDLIRSGIIPVARLTKVHRTKAGSAIALNAARVREGQAPFFGGNVWTDDYAFIEARDNPSIHNQVVAVIDGLLRQGVKAQDIQVLCPQNAGDVGTDMFNALLRWKLNPLAPRQDDVETLPACFEGERLMQTKNNYDLEIFNGDMGHVTQLDEDGSFLLRTEDDRDIAMTSVNLKEMKLGYAITVHKSQGGEKPVIILPISRSHSFTLNRNLLYTGITRGKQKVILIGDKQTALLAARKQDQQMRLTGLVQELRKVCPLWSPEQALRMPTLDSLPVNPPVASPANTPTRSSMDLDDDGWGNPAYDGFDDVPTGRLTVRSTP